MKLALQRVYAVTERGSVFIEWLEGSNVAEIWVEEYLRGVLRKHVYIRESCAPGPLGPHTRDWTRLRELRNRKPFKYVRIER